MARSHFPLGIASGSAFLGREEESLQLANHIDHGRHTLLLSPRRYGKSSLVKHVIKKSGLPAYEIDLFLVSDEIAIERKLLKGVKALIQQVSDTPDQWLKDLMNYFKKSHKKWFIGIKGVGLEIEPDANSDTADTILEALNALELILKKKQQKAVLFLDEIQEIANVKNSKAIEGAIRHFAQEAKFLTLVFSGSNQHMLKHMFNDRNRPLYALCERINLDRLPQSIYKKYLDKIAKKMWDETIKEPVFEKIMEITECHPRTVYVLCGRVWDQQAFTGKQPSVKSVQDAWQKYIQAKYKDIRNELKSLSAGQLKALTLVASHKFTEISGKSAQQSLNLSSSAIVQALAVLEERGYLEKLDSGKYRVIDPIITWILNDYNTEALN